MELNKNYKFDIDLAYGVKTESLLMELFNGNGKIEVKSERDKWVNTGNIAIEFMSRGKKSGILSTESDYWFHSLNIEDEIVMIFVFKTNVLREWIRARLHELKEVKGGDDNTSKLILIPIRRLHEISSNSK